MSNPTCCECKHQVEELEQELAEVQRHLSDKQEQEGAMLQVCICMIDLFNCLFFICLLLIQMLRVVDTYTYEGLDASGARTKGNRRCTKICWAGCRSAEICCSSLAGKHFALTLTQNLARVIQIKELLLSLVIAVTHLPLHITLGKKALYPYWPCLYVSNDSISSSLFLSLVIIL